MKHFLDYGGTPEMQMIHQRRLVIFTEIFHELNKYSVVPVFGDEGLFIEFEYLGVRFRLCGSMDGSYTNVILYLQELIKDNGMSKWQTVYLNARVNDTTATVNRINIDRETLAECIVDKIHDYAFYKAN